MSYLFNEDNLDIVDRICKINNIKYSDLDVSSFTVDYDLEVLSIFKNGLLTNKDKKFLIVGDYDCDGICATAIIKRLLDYLKIESNFYIPSRSKEGYGLNNKIVETAIVNQFDCLFLVDNGVNCHEQLSLCRQANIKTFIIDHHEYETVDADYLLHPTLFNGKYSDMCAAGLCCLLSNSFRVDDLSIVYGGLATLADMVKVLNYNRYLLVKMMDILRTQDIYQIRLLIKSDISYDSLSFEVIPKINAVSRLDEFMNVNHLVQYLLASRNECVKFLDKIETINNKRKEMSKTMYEYCLSSLNKDDNFIIVYSKDFVEGICGLVANRLMYAFNKPAIVFSLKNDELIGSARSPIGFNAYDYLKDFNGFISFGGHENALGMSIKLDSLIHLKEYINSHPFTIKQEEINCLLFNEDDLNLSTYDKIASLQPYGTGFKKPLIAIRDNSYKCFLVKNKYPKFTINSSCSAICFNDCNFNQVYSYFIGTLNQDSYHKNAISLTIEDLI